MNDIPFLLQIGSDPTIYEVAMSSRNCIFWKDTINDEMNSIISNKTRKLVDLPQGSKLLDANGCLGTNIVSMVFTTSIKLY